MARELEDRAGFVIPRWRGGTDPAVPPVCLAPWRAAPEALAPILVDAVGIRRGDVFVDLGSGDGSVVNGVVARVGCCGVGIEASGDLVVLCPFPCSGARC